MTAAAKIPDFDGEPVNDSAITIAGVGATMGSTLAMESGDLIRKHDKVYVILYAECAKISFPDDKDGNQVRVAHLHPEEAYWADSEYAQQFIQRQREERQRRLDELDGQTRLDLESEAEQAEADDANLPPDEVAAKAAERAKRPTA